MMGVLVKQSFAVNVNQSVNIKATNHLAPRAINQWEKRKSIYRPHHKRYSHPLPLSILLHIQLIANQTAPLSPFFFIDFLTDADKCAFLSRMLFGVTSSSSSCWIFVRISSSCSFWALFRWTVSSLPLLRTLVSCLALQAFPSISYGLLVSPTIIPS